MKQSLRETWSKIWFAVLFFPNSEPEIPRVLFKLSRAPWENFASKDRI